jgi:hypothetical protein
VNNKVEFEDTIPWDMWLWYSWQSAAVVNENGDFLDIEVNDGNFSVQGAKERLQLVARPIYLLRPNSFSRDSQKRNQLLMVLRNSP